MAPKENLLASVNLGPHVHLARALGKTVRLARQIYQISQKDFAAEVALPVKRLRAIEHGTVLPTLVEYGRICHAIVVRTPKKSRRSSQPKKK